jgi:hypothetical protein
MPQRIAHIQLHPIARNPRHRSQRTPHILGAHLPVGFQFRTCLDTLATDP